MHLDVNPSVPFSEGCKGYLVFFLFLSHVTLGVPVISFRFYMLYFEYSTFQENLCHLASIATSLSFAFPVLTTFRCQARGKLPRDPNESQPGENPRFRVSLPLFCFFCSVFFRFQFSLRTEVMEGNVTQHTHSQNSTGLITSITSSTLGATEVLQFVLIWNFDSSVCITFRARASGITWRHLHQLLPSSSSSRRRACIDCVKMRRSCLLAFTHITEISARSALQSRNVDLNAYWFDNTFKNHQTKPYSKAVTLRCFSTVLIFFLINWHFSIEIFFFGRT